MKGTLSRSAEKPSEICLEPPDQSIISSCSFQACLAIAQEYPENLPDVLQLQRHSRMSPRDLASEDNFVMPPSRPAMQKCFRIERPVQFELTALVFRRNRKGDRP
jgi:hypothetical protein